MNREKTGPNQHVLVVGAGPAGLMAAEVLSAQGVAVTVCEAKPSVGRKFLMAGKSGLNLTMDAPLHALLPAYSDATAQLTPILKNFDSQAVQSWARGLGQDVFTGSTGRVFPTAMKASPLLRAWLARLQSQGVSIRTRMVWRGQLARRSLFDGPAGEEELQADAVVLATGGASWSRLGADGTWADILQRDGVGLAPFQPANVGARVTWSPYMNRHFGSPLKGVALSAGAYRSRGEAVLSVNGLEGGGIYAISRGFREGAPLEIDLLPDLSEQAAIRRVSRPRGKASLSTHLQRTLLLDPVKRAMAQEFARPLPTDPHQLIKKLKELHVPIEGLQPLDQAISVAGGVKFSELDAGLMLRARPGVFCAGEMLDWEAPTGGYLLTACFATGRWAGEAVLRYLSNAVL